MKLFLSLVAATPLLLSACSNMPLKPWNQNGATSAHGMETATQQANYGVQTVDYHVGISSVTVERLAQKNGCTSSKGAALIAGTGPVEMYRISCDDGHTVLARCELRQCELVRKQN